MMTQLDEQFPHYDFARHKGYVTPDHAAALHAHGPCPEHRASYINVRRAAALHGSAVVSENDWMAVMSSAAIPDRPDQEIA